MRIVETSIFSRIIDRLLTTESYRHLQLALISNPEVGQKIRGSGGIRKLRWPGSGRGKRGGIRIIYYWAVRDVTILLLYAYPKGDRDDLTHQQIKALKRAIETGLK